ncbi:MAG: acyl-CoA dehydrogenase N-terminal domain-containing protein, partial [Rhodospirillales bacterium]|nr:acyl-CoA dehydrogenase N-terminal domain-containing protein [Rhodospirillales bacterium]
MVTYTAPVADMRFTLRAIVGLEDLARLPGCENAAPDVVDAVLDEAAKFAG